MSPGTTNERAEPHVEQETEILPSMPGGNPYTEEGVDRTLIWSMLQMTPGERLEMLRQSVRSIRRMLRDARRV